jgi:hypothetical protein
MTATFDGAAWLAAPDAVLFATVRRERREAATRRALGQVVLAAGCDARADAAGCELLLRALAEVQG